MTFVCSCFLLICLSLTNNIFSHLLLSPTYLLFYFNTLFRICANLIDYEVAVADNTCFSEMEEQMTLIGHFLGLSKGFVIGEKCKLETLRLFCTQAYPKCEGNIDNPLNPTVYQKPCRSVCLSQNTVCSSDIVYTTALKTIQVDFPDLAAGILDMLDCDNPLFWHDDITTPTCNSGPTKQPTATDLIHPRCETYTGNVCKDALPGRVYIPGGGYTQEYLESVIEPLQVILLFPNFTNYDAHYMQALLCQQAFYECDSKLPVPIPKLPCRELCTEAMTRNAHIFEIIKEKDPIRFAEIEQYLPDCTATGFLQKTDCKGTIIDPGTDKYPEIAYEMFGMTVPCSKHSNANTSDVLASAVLRVNAPCEGPIVIPDDPWSYNTQRILDTTCAVACPVKMFSVEEYKNMDRLLIIFSSISLFCGILLTVTFLLFKANRNMYVLYMSIAMSVVYASFLLNAILAKIKGKETIAHLFCRNNAEEYQFTNGWYCLITGIIFTYFLVTAISWWLIQATDLFLKVILMFNPPIGSKEAKLREYCYHGFAWGSPLLFLVPALARKQIGGFSGGTPWCFYSLGRGNETSLDISTYIFFLPIMIYAVIGCIMMGAVLVKLIRGYCRERSMAAKHKEKGGSVSSTNGNKSSLFRVYFRLIAFIVFMSFLWVFLFAYKLYGQQKKPGWLASMVEMYTCVMLEKPFGGVCGEVPKERMDIRLIYALMVICCGAGTVITLISLLSKEIIKSWLALIHRKMPCCTCLRQYDIDSYHPVTSFRSKKTNLNKSGVTGISSGGGGLPGSSGGSGHGSSAMGGMNDNSATGNFSTDQQPAMAARRKQLFAGSTTNRRMNTSSHTGPATPGFSSHNGPATPGFSPQNGPPSPRFMALDSPSPPSSATVDSPSFTGDSFHGDIELSQYQTQRKPTYLQEEGVKNEPKNVFTLDPISNPSSYIKNLDDSDDMHETNDEI